MQRLKTFFRKLRQNLKFSVTNPDSFNEVWTFYSNGIRVISLVLILLIISSVVSVYLTGGFDRVFSDDNISIEREQLENQSAKINELYSKLESQDSYVNNIKSILNGETQEGLTSDTIVSDEVVVDVSQMNEELTEEEKELAKKVKDDMSTGLANVNESIVYFGSPVVGVVSQEFDGKKHPGIDVVTEKDMAVKACLSGTVIYAGYTQKDGHIVIIEHQNKYISIYKHNKRVLKKIGAKVQLGDPISIVGNTGENSDGPHLHFELWHDQSPVNPSEYMSFSR